MAKIRFETGQVVNFDGNPTPQDVEEVAQRLGITKQAPQTKPLGYGTTEGGPTAGGLIGMAKGVGSSLLGGAQVLTKGLERSGILPQGTSNNETAQFLREKVTPKTTQEKTGFAIEQLGEFLVPIAQEQKLYSAVANNIGKLPKAGQFAVKLATSAGLGAADFGVRTAIQTGGNENEIKKAATIGGIFSGLGSILEQSAPLVLKKARDFYQSAIKPSTSKKAPSQAGIVETGLQEGIVLSEGGVQKVADTVDDLENALGEAIDKAAGITRDSTGKVVSKAKIGATIKVKKLQSFVEEAKSFFSDITDVAFADKAVKDIESVYKNFSRRYGNDIPIEVAQQLKVKTGQWLRRAYGELSSPILEANKQLVRGLKEGIVAEAPVVGDINARLKSLYEFDEALSRARGRIKNLNLLGLGTKVIGAGVGGKTGAILAAINEIVGGPTVKSLTAIQLYKIGKLLGRLNPTEAESVISRIPAIATMLTARGQSPD